MFTHNQIWAALDKIAERNRLSISGLSRRAGLDPTSFNKSKRITGNGRMRWPSTESVSKVLECTGTSIEEFTAILAGRDPDEAVAGYVPMLRLDAASDSEHFDDAGFPQGNGWRTISFPSEVDRYSFALEVTNDDLLPVYRRGDSIVVSPDSKVRQGDRVIVKKIDGELTIGVLRSQSTDAIELTTLVPSLESRSLDMHDIEWMSRIVWASQ